MGDFALVTEGVSDHQVLKNILIGFFQPQREPDITFDHPAPTVIPSPGGWTLVVKYLREKKYRQALQLNEYIVVQVDADVAEDKGFDVPKQGADGPLAPEEIVSKVIDRLKQEIGAADWETYGRQFIFAVGVEQIECWVLPLWYADAKGEQTANCIKRLGECPQLRDELKAKNLPWITHERKVAQSYDLASRRYKKRKELERHGPRSPSLRLFLVDLKARGIQLASVE